MKTLPIILLISTVLFFQTACAQVDARPQKAAEAGPDILQPGQWWNLYSDQRNDALKRTIRAVKIVRLSNTHPSWVQITFPKNRKEHGAILGPVAKAHDDDEVAFDVVIAEWEESITEWKSIWINLDFVVSMTPVETDKAHHEAADEAAAVEYMETEIGQGQLIGILQVPSIQKELLLTDEQIAKIAEINQTPIPVTFSEAIAPLKTMLTDDQLKEFKRTALPGLMVRAFTVSEVRDHLELTQNQLTSIAAIQAKLKTQLQPFQEKIEQGGSPKNHAEEMKLERDTATLHEAAYVKALELLTVEQRKKWKTFAKFKPLRSKKGG